MLLCKSANVDEYEIFLKIKFPIHEKFEYYEHELNIKCDKF